MRLIESIDLIRTIDDKQLKHAVCNGFFAIYEGADDMNIEEMESETYDEAFQDMTAHFSTIDDPEMYRSELEPFAFQMFKAYQGHQHNIESFLETLDEDEFKFVMTAVNELYHLLSGQNSFDEYTRVLKDNTQKFVTLFGGAENFVRLMNELLESEKFNALYHRVKDYFLPQLLKLKKAG